MTRKAILALVCSAAISVVACNRANRTDNERAATPPAATGGVLTESPQDWVQKAIEKNRAEIQLGELAAEKAQNQQVKQFARTMVEDHRKALEDLKQIGEREHMQIAEGATDNDRELYSRLSKSSGAEFDREYMEAMVDAHQDTLDMLEDKADDRNDRATGTSGTTATGTRDSADAERDRIHQELSQWAAKMAPKVREHLEKAKQIKEQVD